MSDSYIPDAGSRTTPYLVESKRDLADWTHYFRDAEIPVLSKTAQELEDLGARAVDEDIDAAMITGVIQADPLMVIKVIVHSAASRRVTESSTEPETITSMLLMTGVEPFFQRFGSQPTLEDWLIDQPLARERVLELLVRAERARRFALGFAVHRSDLDVEVIQQAAFLHDFAEILMWCHAPTLMLRIHDAQRADPHLRSAIAQLSVLHIKLDDLAVELMALWHWPALLIRIGSAKQNQAADVRNVMLAVRLARHTMRGWNDAAIPDDIAEIAELLNASPRIALAFAHKIDSAA